MLVSIIMSAYNAEKTVAEAIDSVLRQTYEAFEYIIVDDGSTDGTLNILNAYKERDDRIKIISHKNRGAGLSRNKAIASAKGKLLAFLDADDIWLPNKLEVQVAIHKKMQEEVIIVTEMIHYDKVQDVLLPCLSNKSPSFEIYDDWFMRLLRDNFFFPPHTVLVPKVFFLNIAQFTDDISGQDYFPFLMFALYGKKIVKIGLSLYGERTLQGSLQRSPKSHYYGGLARYKAVSSILRNRDKYQKYLNTERIEALKKANDRFLGWTAYGARKCMRIFEVLSFLMSHFSAFFNKMNFVNEFLKTILYPIKKIFNKLFLLK